MELASDDGRMESHFSPFGDNVCTKRTIGIENVLDALDGTPR
jgi:hypothetical protein